MVRPGAFHFGRVQRLSALGLACTAATFSPAVAQDVPSSELPAKAGDRITDILVTARRQPEPIQRTPVSVMSFSAADLEARSVTNLRALQSHIPNLTFAPSQNVGEAAGN